MTTTTTRGRARKPKLGRPELPAKVYKGTTIRVRCNREELRALDALASAWSADRSETIRRAVVEALARTTKGAR